MERAPQRIRVLLLDGERAACATLVETLGRAQLAVVGVVGSAAAVRRACEELCPEVVLVDAALGPECLAAVEELMAFRPTPVLVFDDGAHAAVAARALDLGALETAARPQPGSSPEQLRSLEHRVRLLSGVKVIRHVRGRRRARLAPTGEGLCAVGIAASLGGPRALAALLGGLPRPFPAPVLVVQHISEGFSHGLASWLAGEAGREVREAQGGEPLSPGAVLVAPTGRHLTVGERRQVVLDDAPPVDGFRPSATVLFASLARRFGPRAIGVVLTGMGRDGAEGLAAVRAAGGYTLAQDERSSVVFGMARAAVEAGAVDRLVPLEAMAAELAAAVAAAVEGAPR